MHAGKSSLAQHLKIRGYDRKAFADPVKEIGAEMLNVFLSYMNDPRAYDEYTINEIKGHPAIRGLLQLVGTEIGREWFGPQTIWIDLFKERVKQYYLDAEEFGFDPKIVNDDCRFVNEAAALKELGFVIIKLHRPEDQRIQSIINALKKDNPEATSQQISTALEKILSHPSETEVEQIEVDYILSSTTMRSLERIAKILASENAVEQLANTDNSDLIQYTPNDYVSNDLPLGMRAAYAHS
jgi:hypothetical protein